MTSDVAIKQKGSNEKGQGGASPEKPDIALQTLGILSVAAVALKLGDFSKPTSAAELVKIIRSEAVNHPEVVNNFGGKEAFEKTLKSVETLDTNFQSTGGIFFKLGSSAAETAQNFADTQLRWRETGVRPSIVGEVAHYLDGIGLERNDPLYKANLLVAARAEIEVATGSPAYHNQNHFLDVNAQTIEFLKKNNELAEQGVPGTIKLSKQELAEGLLSANRHDVGHPGGKNITVEEVAAGQKLAGDAFRLEQQSVDITEPLLRAAGLDEATIKRSNVVVLTTSPDGNGPGKLLSQIDRLHKEGKPIEWEKLEGSKGFPQLKILADDPKARVMSGVVRLSDVGESSSEGNKANYRATLDLQKEWEGYVTAGDQTAKLLNPDPDGIIRPTGEATIRPAAKWGFLEFAVPHDGDKLVSPAVDAAVGDNYKILRTEATKDFDEFKKNNAPKPAPIVATTASVGTSPPEVVTKTGPAMQTIANGGTSPPEVVTKTPTVLQTTATNAGPAVAQATPQPSATTSEVVAKTSPSVNTAPAANAAPATPAANTVPPATNGGTPPPEVVTKVQPVVQATVTNTGPAEQILKTSLKTSASGALESGLAIAGVVQGTIGVVDSVKSGNKAGVAINGTTVLLSGAGLVAKYAPQAFEAVPVLAKSLPVVGAVVSVASGVTEVVREKGSFVETKADGSRTLGNKGEAVVSTLVTTGAAVGTIAAGVAAAPAILIAADAGLMAKAGVAADRAYRANKDLDVQNQQNSKPFKVGDGSRVEQSGAPSIRNYENLTRVALDQAKASGDKDAFSTIRKTDFSQGENLPKLAKYLNEEIQKQQKIIADNKSSFSIPDWLRIVNTDSADKHMQAQSDLAPLMAAKAELALYKKDLKSYNESAAGAEATSGAPNNGASQKSPSKPDYDVVAEGAIGTKGELAAHFKDQARGPGVVPARSPQNAPPAPGPSQRYTTGTQGS